MVAEGGGKRRAGGGGFISSGGEEWRLLRSLGKRKKKEGGDSHGSQRSHPTVRFLSVALAKEGEIFFFSSEKEGAARL